MRLIEIRGLAKATCAWLAYKHITGFDGSLGEAILAIPISEYLKSTGHWNLESEVLYRKLGLPESPELSCDFAGTRIHGDQYRFVLETKYLKDDARNRSRDIAADLIRLSLPLEESLKRYFLLAGNSSHFNSGSDRFLVESKLFDLAEGGGRYFRPICEVQNNGFRNKFPRYNELLTAKEKHVCDYAYIQCGANVKMPIKGEETFQVVIWSVGRSERSAKNGLSEAETT